MVEMSNTLIAVIFSLLLENDSQWAVM